MRTRSSGRLTRDVVGWLGKSVYAFRQRLRHPQPLDSASRWCYHHRTEFFPASKTSKAAFVKNRVSLHGKRARKRRTRLEFEKRRDEIKSLWLLFARGGISKSRFDTKTWFSSSDLSCRCHRKRYGAHFISNSEKERKRERATEKFVLVCRGKKRELFLVCFLRRDQSSFFICAGKQTNWTGWDDFL